MLLSVYFVCVFLGSGRHTDFSESQSQRQSQAIWRSSSQEHWWTNSGECCQDVTKAFAAASLVGRIFYKWLNSNHICWNQDALAPYKHIEEDLKSLKEVLEMKNQQIHQQDLKITELEKIVGFKFLPGPMFPNFPKHSCTEVWHEFWRI